MSTQEVIMNQETEVNIPDNRENNIKAKKAYSAMGLRVTVYGILYLVLQFAYVPVMAMIFGEQVVYEPWYTWLMIIIPSYVIAFPIFALISKNVEKFTIEKRKIGFGKYLCCIFMDAGICGVGIIIGTILNMAILLPFGGNLENSNALANMMLGSDTFWRVLTVGILAPIFEELVFRKYLVDRIYKYGEGLAIVTSGLLFGLFHGNFSQFFFATGLGMFFAYLYIRTGKVGYTIGLHMVINLCTSVITLGLLQNMDMDLVYKLALMDPVSPQAQALSLQILPQMLLLMGWLGILGASALAGVILWICLRKRLFLKKHPEGVVQNKFKTAWLNAGVIAFFVFAVILFIIQYSSMIG